MSVFEWLALVLIVVVVLIVISAIGIGIVAEKRRKNSLDEFKQRKGIK